MPTFTHYDRSTQRQRALRVEHQTESRRLFIELLTKAKAFRDAQVPLPHMEDGVTVVNGANRWMSELGETYYYAAMSLSHYIDSEWVSLEAERLGFRRSGFYSRPNPESEWSYVHGKAFRDVTAEDLAKIEQNSDQTSSA